MADLSKILFVHDGRAAYPEIAAYRYFFAGSFQTEETDRKRLAGRSDLAESVCWHMMGFYPEKAKAGLVIHDYRSLSVGRLRWLKDRAKQFLNAQPDVRIFQNAEMREAAGFSDDVPTFLLPMGVPENSASFRKEAKGEELCDFAYIGVMSEERRTFLMLDSFLRRFGAGKTFYLYGEPEESIAARYRKKPNIVFKGKWPQADLFAALCGARVAVNYFPNHNPHRMQTPTKLLEYAALGLRVLCNEHVQSRRAAESYGISCLWGETNDMFRNVPDDLDWADNAALDPAPFLWPAVIAASGLPAFLAQKAKA